MIEMKLSFKSYSEALECLTHLARIEGSEVKEMVKTHDHVEPPKPAAKKKPAKKAEPVVEEKVEEKMPEPPVFENPVPEPAVDPASEIPFNDPKGLTAYVMDAYKSLGADKGAGIQQVLSKIGYKNISDVQSKDYAAMYAGIEELKNG